MFVVLWSLGCGRIIYMQPKPVIIGDNHYKIAEGKRQYIEDLTIAFLIFDF